MRKLFIFFTAVFILSGFTVIAQTGTVKGTINTSDNYPAAGVSIGIKGKKAITVTNNKGAFEIRKLIPGNYIIVASFAGLETK